MAIPLLAGFNGSALVDGYQVLATNGTVTLENTQTFVTLMDIIPDSIQRSKVLYAPGIYATSGSLSWDVHSNAMDLLLPSRLLQRGYSFTVSMWGGNIGSNYAGKQVQHCYATSITMQGAQGGLLNVSLSFISPDAISDWNGGSYISTRSDSASNTPYGYWYSGNANIPVKDWNLSINQDVTPVHLNQYAQQSNSGTMYAKYMKCGLWNTDLSVTTFRQLSSGEEVSDLNNVVVATKAFNIVGLVRTRNYNFTGSSDASTYSYTFGSASMNLLPNVTIVS